MCPYQRIDHHSKSILPICEYTKELCTYCVYGNFDNYNKAQEAKNKEKKYTEEGK